MAEIVWEALKWLKLVWEALKLRKMVWEAPEMVRKLLNGEKWSGRL